MSLLETIGSFRKINELSQEQLIYLAAELRTKIITTITRNGGHLASSLGAVELTIALLRVFNPDRDVVIFDVGHQSYAYKLLTDRLDRFNTIRTKNGISGFPRISESKYDFFSTGHSSTSISAALGYAKARDIQKKSNDVIAVIGDGALLNGVAFEALNCIDTTKSKVIIVLNDNRMSINNRTGGMAKHLAELSANPLYNKIKNYIKYKCRSFNNGDQLSDFLDSLKGKIKSLLIPTNVFEEIGINYWGPFDGHDIDLLEHIFSLAQKYDKSVIIHIVTTKGKGYAPAEENPVAYHGISASHKKQAPIVKDFQKPWSVATADSLEYIASIDPKVFVCTAAMKAGTKLSHFEKKYPSQFIDVGISEEHMLIFAAGLSAGGVKPVVCIYSTFLQRAADQVVHDICLQNLPVLICVDRAGLVGADGETHHGMFDVAWFKSVPNMHIFAPRDVMSLNKAICDWQQAPYPLIIRYPRGKGYLSVQRNNDINTSHRSKFEAEILRKGKKICLVSYGSTIPLALESAEILKKDRNIDVTVVDLRYLKPLDFESISNLSLQHDLFVFIEETPEYGCVGSDIIRKLYESNYKGRCKEICVPDEFIPHASTEEQWVKCGLTVTNIIKMCDEYGYKKN